MENLHGGDIYTDGILKHREIIDFSSNINPYGISDKVKYNIDKLWESAIRYPDFKYRLLKQSISEYIKKYDDIEVDYGKILLGNGAMEIIDILISQFNSITIVIPSFIEYEASANKYNKKIVFVELNHNMEYNYKSIKQALINTEALIIGNPNNPSGNIINKNQFEKIIMYCEKENKKVIIDEAFVEFTKTGTSFVNKTQYYKCLFIIRAFTKFFGMPGARLGYCISSNKKLIEQLSDRQLTWNINCFAEYSAINAFKDEQYIENAKKWIKNEIPYMIKNLNTINFIDKVYNTNCNFILCKLKYINNDVFYNYMLANNILIRKCDNFKGLDSGYIRLAIKARKFNDILLHTIRRKKFEDYTCKTWSNFC